MSSFSALSENAIGSATTVAEATAFFTAGAAATSTAGTLSLQVIASPTLSSVSATMTADAATGPQANGLVNLTSVSGTTTVNSVIGKGAGDAENVSGVSATSSVNAPTATGTATIIPIAVVGTTTLQAVDFDAKGNTNALTGVSLTLAAQEFDDEDAQASITLSPAVATGSVSWNTDPSLTGGIYTTSVIYLNTDFNRKRVVNIVPRGNYTVVINERS